MRSRRPALVLLALVLLVPAGLTGAAGPAAAAPAVVHTVSMKDFAYAPARLQVKVGQLVEWHYDEQALDPMPNCESPYFQIPGAPVSCPGHSATSVAKLANGKPVFDSGVHRAEGFPFRIGFSVPGVFPYFCVVHGGASPNNPITHMDGVLVALPPRPGFVDDANDVRGLFDLRRLSAVRDGSGRLTVTLTTWDSWATSSLREGGRYRLRALFDVNTDGAITAADVVVVITFAGGKLVARVTGVDGASTLAAVRVGGTGVRFVLPSSSSAAKTSADHQVAADARAPSPDRAPASPGWLPILSG